MKLESLELATKMAAASPAGTFGIAGERDDLSRLIFTRLIFTRLIFTRLILRRL